VSEQNDSVTGLRDIFPYWTICGIGASNGSGTVKMAGSPGSGSLPEIVFVPARPDARPGCEPEVIFEVREVSDGGRALPVFTTVERLVSALGPRQPWIALPLREVEQIMAGAGVHRVALDPDAEPGAWRWQASGIEALGRKQ
jgi:hypothetical protein